MFFLLWSAAGPDRMRRMDYRKGDRPKNDLSGIDRRGRGAVQNMVFMVGCSRRMVSSRASGVSLQKLKCGCRKQDPAAAFQSLLKDS